MPSISPLRPLSTVFRKFFPFFAPKDGPRPIEDVTKAKPATKG